MKSKTVMIGGAQSGELSEKTVTLISNIDKTLQMKRLCSYQILRNEKLASFF
jgi:hypothetical protein